MDANLLSIPTPQMDWKTHRGFPTVIEAGTAAIIGLASLLLASPVARSISDSGNSGIAGLASFIPTAVQDRAVTDAGAAKVAGLASLSAMAVTQVSRSVADAGNAAIAGLGSLIIPTQRNESVADGGNSAIEGVAVTVFNSPIVNYFGTPAINTSGPYVVGMRFSLTTSKIVNSLGFNNPITANSGAITLALWDNATQALLASVSVPDLSVYPVGPVQVPLNAAIFLNSGQVYVCSALVQAGTSWPEGPIGVRGDVVVTYGVNIVASPTLQFPTVTIAASYYDYFGSNVFTLT